MGGIETHVDQVTRRLAARGDLRMTVLATDRTRSRPQHEARDGFDVIRIPAWPRENDYHLAPGIYRTVLRGDWDLIHCQGIHTAVPLIAMAAARRARVPYVVSFHTGGHSSVTRSALRSLQWKAAGKLLRAADHLIGVSRYEARLIQEKARLDPARVSVIRNGGGLALSDSAIAPTPGKVLSIGRLERYKGHHRAIEALAYLRRTHPDASLEILGSGPYEAELRSLAQRLGLAAQVNIRHIDPADRLGMAHALAAASVVAAFSDYEAHPVAVMEALTAGRPVVGYDIAGMSDLVEDGYVTGLAPGASPVLAAQTLTAAMSAPPRALAELPTWDTCAAALSDVYRSVLGSAFSNPRG
jgi:glycosyltransferase involved in cell wall biosynthesis